MEISFEDEPFDFAFHPSDQLVATGLISGNLILNCFTAVSPTKRDWEIKVHQESCRAVRFIFDGRAILTGSADCSMLVSDTETGSAITRLEKCHSAPVNRIVNLTESTVASGDDAGCIKVWDLRQRVCCYTFEGHTDYITDMTYMSDSMKLIGTSGDGTLSVCNLRTNKVQSRSEFSEDELLSVVIMKNGQKLICGTPSGSLLLYSFGYFKDCSDRFVDLAPNPVNAILKLDEDRLITASGNGIINLVGILPNRIIQPIAEHSEYSVEGLAFSHDRKFLGSISPLDKTLKLWDLEDLLQGSGVALNHSAVDNTARKSSKGRKRKSVNKSKDVGSFASFFADL